MSILLYRLFLSLYVVGIRIASLKSPKARLWLRGRKGIKRSVSEAALKLRQQPGKVVWMHCASLGEFEQGRPLIEAMVQQDPAIKIVLTFFSPSGYEVRKDYPLAAFITYLPIDSAGNARFWLDQIQPDLVVFVKYEFWYYYLTAVKKRNIPLLLVSGKFRAGQPFFKWYGNLHRWMLHCFTHCFVQQPSDGKLLADIGINNVTVSGDTRFDRVITIAENAQVLPVIAAFCKNYPVLVAGSTWTEDEEVLDHYSHIHPNIRFIIAPHEVDADNILESQKLFPNSIRYSELTALLGAAPEPAAITPEWVPDSEAHLPLLERFKAANTLIIDNIGLLSQLYRYADITYIGGAFGNGLHNILEAAVYGKPVIFGPSYHKFAEAVDLIKLAAAFEVNNALETEALLNQLFKDQSFSLNAGAKAKKYIYASKGATKFILDYITSRELLGR